MKITKRYLQDLWGVMDEHFNATSLDDAEKIVRVNEVIDPIRREFLDTIQEDTDQLRAEANTMKMLENAGKTDDERLPAAREKINDLDKKINAVADAYIEVELDDDLKTFLAEKLTAIIEDEERGGVIGIKNIKSFYGIMQSLNGK